MSLPPLPKITDADMVLAVFTHESLPSIPNDDFGEPKRLGYLGARVLDQAIAYHYFMKRPVVPAEVIEVQQQQNAFDFTYYLHHYDLRAKIRCAPDQSRLLDTEQEAANFFHKYFGAAFLQSGMGVIQEWVSQALDPGCPTPTMPTGNTPRQHQSGGHASFPSAPSPNQPPPSQPPPPPAYYPQTQPPPLAASGRGFQILAQFNMTAHQRNYTVTYPARSEGPHHTPTWYVQCCLNGEVRGEGSGQNQKQAKELAARQAWTAMGWGSLPDN